MLFSETNPYIRFADIVQFAVNRMPSKTCDCRLLYALSGTAEIGLNGQLFDAAHGSLFCFQPGTAYEIHPHPMIPLLILDFDYTQQYAAIENSFDVIPATRFDPQTAHPVYRFADYPLMDQPLARVNMQPLELQLRTIVQEFRMRRLCFRERCAMLLKALLYEIPRYDSDSDKKNALTDRLLEYIALHFAEPITNQSIADAFNYDPCYLNRLIRTRTGVSLHDYVIRYRITEAAKLLHFSDKSVSQIAMETGFSSLAHFSSTFKQRAGKLPTVYRSDADNAVAESDPAGR